MKIMPSERSFRIWDQGILSRKRAFNSVHWFFSTPWITRTGIRLSWTSLVTVEILASFNFASYFTSNLYANIKLFRLFRDSPNPRFSRHTKPISDKRFVAPMLSRAINNRRDFVFETNTTTMSCFRQVFASAAQLVRGDV